MRLIHKQCIEIFEKSKNVCNFVIHFHHKTKRKTKKMRRVWRTKDFLPDFMVEVLGLSQSLLQVSLASFENNLRTTVI
jgi:hypothetical protein